jgi:hypothetical protein
MKKYLLLTLTLLLCASLFSCGFNFNEELIFGDPEVPTADIDKPTEEVTQTPTEEPTEKPTEPIITIDGITFDKSLKTKLKAAKTYAEVCEILGKEGTLVEHPEVIYYWTGTTDSGNYPVRIKFKASGEKSVICEDVSVTMTEVGYDLSKVPQDVLEQLTIGVTYEEVENIIPGNNRGHFQCGMPVEYQWDFGDDVKINLHFNNRVDRKKQDLSVMYIDFWDSESTNTDLQNFRANLKLGQTIAELNELLGMEGEDAAQGGKYWWDFEDGTRLQIGYYLDPTDTSLPIEEWMKFNGNSQIYLY